MPWLLDTNLRTDDYASTIFELVSRGGIRAVTYRAVAGRVGVSPSTLHDHFPDMRHLLKVVAGRLADRRVEYFGRGVARYGLVAMIPESEFDLRQAIIWSAFKDLARIEPKLGHIVALAREDELRIVRINLGRPLGDPVADAVLSLIEGLEGARTLAWRPMGYTEAGATLATAVSGLAATPAGGSDAA